MTIQTKQSLAREVLAGDAGTSEEAISTPPGVQANASSEAPRSAGSVCSSLPGTDDTSCIIEDGPPTLSPTSTATTLRPYQKVAHDALYAYFEAHGGNPIIEVPTAGGKSWIIAEFIRGVLSAWPDQRVIMLTHVKELIEQNLEKLKIAWPTAPVGVYSAGIGMRQHDSQVLYAGIQSVYNRARLVGWTDLVIIDECHLVNHESTGMYRSFLDALTDINPMLKVIGFTATPFRTGHGYLTEGDDRIFTDIAHRVTIDELLDAGFLSPLVPKRTKALIDTSGVKVRGGEFVQGDLEDLVNDEQLTRLALDEVEAIAEKDHRKHWLLFCTGVAHAEAVRDALLDRGHTAACITGSTPKREREGVISDFRAGRLRALTNANVLTTGFDAPLVDLIAFLRPTMSEVLYVQMMGRGMRLSPETGKENCLVLDFAQNVWRHGPVNKIKPRKSKQGDGETPQKVCPECDSIQHAAVRTCEDCGYEFPPPELKIQTEASHLEIIERAGESSRARMPVTGWYCQVHKKPGKPDSLVIIVNCGLAHRYRKWLCFEHGGYARQAARSLWMRLGGSAPPPDTVAEAVVREGELSPFKAVTVDTSGTYPEIVKFHLEEVEQ